jgi:LPXTG-site transpeptidase (sortase) family protein
MTLPSSIKPKKTRRLSLIAEFVIVFILVASTLVVVANSGALRQRLTYWWESMFGGETYQKLDVDGLGTSSDTIPVDNRLVIPKIAVNAPLLFPATTDPDELLQELEHGVIHYPGTSIPGQEGNAFVTGHSSNYAWSQGNYKSVFALLDQLEIGDEIIVYFEKHKYVYRVSDHRTVAASDTSVLEPSDDTRLTLMTCWPVGTIARRLIVTAQLVVSDSTAEDQLSGLFAH